MLDVAKGVCASSLRIAQGMFKFQEQMTSLAMDVSMMVSFYWTSSKHSMHRKTPATNRQAQE